MITVAALVVAGTLFFFGHHTAAYILACGVLAKLLSPGILTITTLPGRLIAFPSGVQPGDGSRLRTGAVVGVIVQSTVYSAYAIGMTCWAAATPTSETAWISWGCAFACALAPIVFALVTFREDQFETQTAALEIPEMAREVIGTPEARILAFRTQVTSITTVFATICVLGFVAILRS